MLKFISLASYLVLGSEFGYEQLDLRTGQVTQHSSLHTGDLPQSDQDFWSEEEPQVSHRSRRDIFESDTRFTLHENSTGKYPFDTVVKLNSGCSGILISPQHVLTSAHCLHDGKKYLQTQKLRIGVLKGKRLKKRRKTRKRSPRLRREIQEGADSLYPQSSREFENYISYKKNRSSRRKVKRNKRTKGSRKKKPNKEKRLKERKSFQWVKADKLNIPSLWRKNSSDQTDIPNVEHDYAVINLEKKLSQHFMKVTVSPELDALKPNPRVHFSGFDLRKGDQLAYRFCMISGQSNSLIFNKCDALPGSSGAGMYVRYFVPRLGEDVSTKGVWLRRIIGVFSGNNKDIKKTREDKNFNIGTRITPSKFLTICFWVHGDDEKCRQMREKQLNSRPYIKSPSL